jgi:hypothetical protein
MATSTEDLQLTAIINSALESTHPVVQRAMNEEKKFREQTATELSVFLQETRVAITMAKNIASIKQLQDKTLEKIALDLALAKKLNAALGPIPISSTCSYPLKFNKLELILSGTDTFLQENFLALFEQQQIPNEYQFFTSPTEVTRLGRNDKTIYGSSKNTFLKTALLETYLTTTRGNITDATFEQNFVASATKGKWIDHTAMAHVAPIPIDLDSLDSRFNQFTFRYSDDTTPSGLLYTHSGYAFGGDRNNTRPNKPFVPEDCSSWLEKVCGGTKPFVMTTADQLLFNRTKLGVGNVSAQWLASETPANMESTFDVVSDWQKDPQKAIQPGQIYCHRGFNLEKDPTMQESGTGGHTALVLGFKSDAQNSKIVTIGYSREMPDVEGFGVQEFPLFPNPNNKTLMLFSVKGQNAGTHTSSSNTQATTSQPMNKLN